MSVEFISPDRLHVASGQTVHSLQGGARLSAGGNQGVVFFGAMFSAAAGIYHVRVNARMVNPADDPVEFEVFDPSVDCRIYAARQIREPIDLYVRVYDTIHLDFRFRTAGAAFVFEGLSYEALLQDKMIATAGDLSALGRRILDGDGEANALFRVADRLTELGEDGAAAALKAEFIARETRVESRVQSLLLKVHTHTRSKAVEDVTQTTNLSRDQIFHDLWNRNHYTTCVVGMTQKEHQELSTRGYQPRFIDATRFHREPDEPLRLWHDRPLETGRTGEFPTRQPLFERYVDIDRSYQASMARGQGILAYDPVSGRKLTSRHGFLQHYCDLSFIFYRLEGAEVFYLCVGHISGTRLFLYMPRTETIVWICDPWYRNYPAHELVKLLNINLVQFCDKLDEYLGADTKPAAVVGSNIHGHFFWVDLTGLQYAVQNSLSQNLAEIVRVDRQYGDPQAIFPELAHKPSPYFKDASEAFGHCLQNHLLPIHFTDISMSLAFAERLRKAAARYASPAGKPPADAPRPLIWINLRSHTKVWIEQAEGYANILNALFDDYGCVSAYVDGMADCKPLMAEIRLKTRPEVALYDGLHPNIFDTLNWAFAVDAYIAVIGSSLMIVNAMADKAGVAHSEHGHLQQMDWWPTVRPGMTMPLIPEAAQIVEVGEGLYCDYHLDWRVLLEMIRNVLTAHFQREAELDTTLDQSPFWGQGTRRFTKKVP